MCTRTAAAIAAPSPGSCWKAKRSPPRRGSTSEPTGPTVSCASPTPGAWRNSRKRSGGLAGLLPRALPDRLQARALRVHLVGVLGIGLVKGARIHLQRKLLVAQPPRVLAQDLRPHVDVHLGEIGRASCRERVDIWVGCG